MHVYSAKDVEHMLGIRSTTLRSLIRAGHVTPRKDHRGRFQFSFQDLILLRTARALATAKVPARRIGRRLRKLKHESEAGQYALALQVAETGEIRTIRAHPVKMASDDEIHYAHGYAIEDDDPDEALAAYERCLALNQDHLEARLNCGRLLHLAGRLAEAERVYRAALRADATLLFNLAVLLEDLGREAEAMLAYREALDIDPGFADAHFNLARLHELAGNHRDSLRHLLAYRRCQFVTT